MQNTEFKFELFSCWDTHCREKNNEKSTKNNRQKTERNLKRISPSKNVLSRKPNTAKITNGAQMTLRPPKRVITPSSRSRRKTSRPKLKYEIFSFAPSTTAFNPVAKLETEVLLNSGILFDLPCKLSRSPSAYLYEKKRFGRTEKEFRFGVCRSRSVRTIKFWPTREW